MVVRMSVYGDKLVDDEVEVRESRHEALGERRDGGRPVAGAPALTMRDPVGAKKLATEEGSWLRQAAV